MSDPLWRKIIQITTVQETEKIRGAMLALCDDGSVWALPLHRDGEWSRFPDIPQPMPPQEPVP